MWSTKGGGKGHGAIPRGSLPLPVQEPTGSSSALDPMRCYCRDGAGERKRGPTPAALSCLPQKLSLSHQHAPFAREGPSAAGSKEVGVGSRCVGMRVFEKMLGAVASVA